MYYIIYSALVHLPGLYSKKIVSDNPIVDERVELLSIIARLAGYPEYNMEYFRLYTDQINNHFSPYRNHEVVQLAKKLRKENSVSHEKIMTMAIHLDSDLIPRIEFTDKIPNPEWEKENAYEFVRLLKEFYKEAKCKDFFNQNKSLYEDASKKFLPVYEQVDLEWYKTFFEKEPFSKYIIINALGNGGHSYGVSFTSASRGKEIYAIMGAWATDNAGMVTFNKDDYFSILLHEFNHSFTNSLLEKNENLFKDSGEKIYNIVRYNIDQTYNDWKIVLNEALTRACVIKYMKDHLYDQDIINKEMVSQVGQGFIWIHNLVKELDNYSNQRDVYPTLESYMPKLAEAYEIYARLILEYDEKQPKVISINEFMNNDKDVDPTLSEITINFDKTLSDNGYSIFLGSKGKDAFPQSLKVKFSEDKKSVILEFEPLEKDKEYQFILTGKNFKSTEGVPIKNYEVNFKTR